MIKNKLLLISLLFFLPAAFAEPVLIKIMDEELKSFSKASQSQELPPYYTSYEITETESVRVSSSFGSLLSNSYAKNAVLDVDVRVGSYEFDNSHPLRNNSFFGNNRQSFSRSIPTDYQLAPLKNRIWYLTESAYRQAKKDYLTAKANDKMQTEAEDTSADFSSSDVEVHFEEIDKDKLDLDYWRERIKNVTKPFKSQANIYRADANFVAKNEVRWFVNNEGTKIQHFDKSYYLTLTIVSKADDGMEIPRHRTFFTRDLNDFPTDKALKIEAEKIIAEVEELRQAPLLNAYSGPAIFSGKASGVLFHEILGHRVESQRMKNAEDAKTFKHKLGKKITNESINVTFDPTLKTINGEALNGHYRFDNQGVKGQPVKVVEKGVLKNFLLSRTLVEGFEKSNGHGRKTAGRNVTSRQSNLVVETAQPETYEALKQKLLAEVKKRNLEYGLIFDDVVGGFTYTSWGTPNAFNVKPIRVYKLYPDGKQELFRGVDIIGTPLTVFEEILGVGDEYSVFNGACGAESGFVPAALASPPILLSKIEVQRKPKSFNRPPILKPVLDDQEYQLQGEK